MSEPMPNSSELQPKPKIVVGETPIYLTTPIRIGGRDIDSFVIQPADTRGEAGINSSVILMREPSHKKGEEGVLVDKPMVHTDPMQEIPWEKVSGIQWTDETGTTHVITKEDLALAPRPEASDPGDVSDKQPETIKPPARAREVLSGLIEDPNTITIVGLRAYEARALDLADRAMQKLGTPRMQERAQATKNLWERTGDAVKNLDHIFKNVIWKQSIGGIYFHERARQYYSDMLKAAETPFAESAIRLAEHRANERYTNLLQESGFLSRVGTKITDAVRDTLGMRTTVQNMALEEIAVMKANGQIEGAAVLEREAAAVRARFSRDMTKADQFVRTQLGEHLEILDPANEEHRPLVEGVQNLLTRYATGEIPDKAEFDRRTKEFFEATLKNVRPDVFAEAELYSSSLFEAAEVLRTKASHEAGLANIDEAMAGMQIRLGLGTMGEVTSLEPTAVERGIGKVREIFEWLNKKHVIVPMVFNEAAIGTGVALALSAANFVKTMPARALVPLGGGALAGGLFAGWREYGQLNREFMTHLREKETGATFTEMQKRRSWFEKFAVTQRNADEMMATIQNGLYEMPPDGEPAGVLKADLTDDDIRSVLATVSDLQARKAVSETGPKRIGLVRYSGRESIESERSALDIVANRALSDVESYLSSRPERTDALFAGTGFGDYMVKLTTLQTRVLKEGAGTLESADDPVRATLGLVSAYAPEADMIRRRWPFAGKSLSETTGVKAEGIDAILEEFRHEARIEAIKYGAKAGVIGAGVGLAVGGISDLLAGKVDVDIREMAESARESAIKAAADRTQPDIYISDGAHATGEFPISTPTPDHTVIIGGHTFQIPQELSIESHSFGPPDERVTTYDAILRLHGEGPARDISLGRGINADKLIDTLKDTGFTVDQGHEAVARTTQTIDIPGLVTPDQHQLTAVLPDGYHLDQAGTAWNLLNDKNELIAKSLVFGEDGALANAAAVEPQLAAHNLLLDTPKSYDITGVHMVPVERAGETILHETVTLPGPDMTITGEQMSDTNVWNYFLGRSHGDNSVSATNGLKNLFRIYAHEKGTDIVDFPAGSPHEGYFAADEHLREATLGTLGKVREIDLARMPNDVQLHLPETVFGQNGIDQFNDINDAAITHLNELVASGTVAGPGKAIESLYTSDNVTDRLHGIILKLGYLGQDEHLPTKPEDLALLMKELGASGETSANVVGAATETGMKEVPYVFTAQQIAISESPLPETPGTITASVVNIPYATPGEIIDRAQEIGQRMTEWPSEAERAAAFMGITPEAGPEHPWFPIFIPYHAALEPVLTPSELLATTTATEVLYAPMFGYEDAYLTKEAQDARRSPRLAESANASLTQKEEAQWYLSTLTDAERTRLESLTAQTAETPFAEGTRAVVLVPAMSSADPVYDRLNRYTTQTDADGNPLDPAKTEFVIFEPKLTGQSDTSMQADAERFRTEHPDMKVLYVTGTYDSIEGPGRIKSDVSNLALSRITTLADGSPDVAIITDNGGNRIPDTYLADAIGALDAEPSLDMLVGETRLDPEAYRQFPMVFAQHRAFDLMDAMVRHGETGSVPAVMSGNTVYRTSALAAVGGYNPTSPLAEDREMAWMVKNARRTTDTIRSMPELTATADPTETAYRLLQHVGLADKDTPRTLNETYKDMGWAEMAALATEKYTPEMLESDFNDLYASIYPSLKAADPDRFDAYFSRTLDGIGIRHEITDGTVRILSTDTLAANMSADIDTEAFAKDKAQEAVKVTPGEPATSREELETMAGPAEMADTESGQSATEQMASSISSPDLSAEAVAKEDVRDLGETPPETAEQLPEDVQERVNYVLERTTEPTAEVAVTPEELMDYLKTRLELAFGTRITDGNISILGDTVNLDNMQAKSPVGTASFRGKLVTDPSKGLVVDMKSVDYKLPMVMRPASGLIKNQLNHFDQTLLMHLGQRIPKEWKAERIDVVGEKIVVKFNKTT